MNAQANDITTCRARALPAQPCPRGKAGRSTPEACDDRRKGGGAPLRVEMNVLAIGAHSENITSVRARALPAQSCPRGRQGGARRRRATTVGRGAEPPSESK